MLNHHDDCAMRQWRWSWWKSFYEAQNSFTEHRTPPLLLQPSLSVLTRSGEHEGQERGTIMMAVSEGDVTGRKEGKWSADKRVAVAWSAEEYKTSLEGMMVTMVPSSAEGRSLTGTAIHESLQEIVLSNKARLPPSAQVRFASTGTQSE